MTTNLKNPKSPTVNLSNPPYPFRTIVAILLLAGNFLVAAIYFHIVNP
jgi:photosystem I protein